MQKERRRLTVFRLGALAGSLLTLQYSSRPIRICHAFEENMSLR